MAASFWKIPETYTGFELDPFSPQPYRRKIAVARRRKNGGRNFVFK